MFIHLPFLKPRGRRRRRQTGGALRSIAVGAAAVSWCVAVGSPVVCAASAPATLGGVVVEPDDGGARVQIALSGSFHYHVTPHPDRIVIALEGVVASEVDQVLSAGPVTGVIVRPLRDRLPRADIVIKTRVPVDVTASWLDEGTLVLRLGIRTAGAQRPPRPSSPGGSAGASGGLPAAGASAPSPPSPSPLPPPAGHAGMIAGRAVIPRSLHVEIGSGQLLQIDGLVRVAVSDPHVLGAVPVSDQELLVTGRSAGRATMYVWEGRSHLLAYTVDVLPAPDRAVLLERLLAALFPSAAIAVTEVPGVDGSSAAASLEPPAGSGAPTPGAAPVVPSAPMSTGLPATPSIPPASGPSPSYPRRPVPASPSPNRTSTDDSSGVPPSSGATPPGPALATPVAGLILTGAVETQVDRVKVEQIAHAFSSTVVDLLSVRRPLQIKLQVEVVELSQTALRSLGITWGGGEAVPGGSPALNGGVYNLQVITAPGVGTTGLDVLIAQIQALSQRGLARLLAQPSLVVLAGRSASLLLGGQVPIPVAGQNGTVTIEYRDFGVILNAHPDYQDDGRVFMQITPEVSTLDFANAIKVSGFTIPALRVRRVQTVVSMLPTQTLVLGGLLQRQDSELVQKIPLLGDLPIVGPLFRSRTFQRQESDLVIFVTPILAESEASPPSHP
jgi:Flp pilus assembly secretin CpaC